MPHKRDKGHPRRVWLAPGLCWIKTDSQTLVTEMDFAAENAILKILRNYINYRIPSEESGLTGSGDGPFWVGDLLNGTSNIARKLLLFAVSMALVFAIGIIIFNGDR